MNGIYMAGAFLTVLGLSFGFFYRLEKQGPRILTNSGQKEVTKE